MSMTIFPAAPNTYVLERERGADVARKIPVVGFQHIQGGIVFPLCAINLGGLTLGRALLTPDGFITDPAFGVVCGDINEWMTLTGTAAYWSSAERQELAAEPMDDPNMETVSSSTRGKNISPPKRIPDKPAGKPQEFINKTFWQFVGERGDVDYIFMVEGGSPAPAKNAPGFKKIKRDEFMAEKKAGTTVVDDWQTGEVEDAGSHDSGDPVDDLGEEDDGSNLI